MKISTNGYKVQAVMLSADFMHLLSAAIANISAREGVGEATPKDKRNRERYRNCLSAVMAATKIDYHEIYSESEQE